MEHIYEQIAHGVNFVGFAIILIGSLRGLVFYLMHEGGKLVGRKSRMDPDAIRCDFGAYLLLGLEFSVAADIILTLLEPDTEGVLTLGGLIIIRTVISYFVGRERAELRRELSVTERPAGAA